MIKPDYAKWMLDDPRINFPISQKCGATKGVEHLGLQVEDEAELRDVYGRLKAANGPVLEEGATTCCYAKSEKSWNEFTGPDAPPIDLAITVCGNAAGEACPVFMGAPLKAHWGLPDPADVTGDDAAVDAAFEQTWRWLELRVQVLLAMPIESMDRAELSASLTAIGAMEGAA